LLCPRRPGLLCSGQLLPDAPLCPDLLCSGLCAGLCRSGLCSRVCSDVLCSRRLPPDLLCASPKLLQQLWQPGLWQEPLPSAPSAWLWLPSTWWSPQPRWLRTADLLHRQQQVLCSFSSDLLCSEVLQLV